MVIIDALSGSMHWASVVVTDRSREKNKDISYSFPSEPYTGNDYILYSYEVPHEMTHPRIQQYLTIGNS